jgi:hypothetical protein
MKILNKNFKKVKNEDMIRIINGTPDDEKQKKRINQIIEKKEVLLNDLQKNLSEIQESFSVNNFSTLRF